VNKVNVAILGATGAVGQELLEILLERQFPINSLKLLASPRSAGRELEFNGQKFVIEAVSAESFKDVDIAFFCAGGSVSQEWAQVATNAGAVVIDNTSAFRMDPNVPLVVPEVNGEAALNHQGIIANPNCSTIIMAMALKPIYNAVGIKRVVVSTYQAVSGAGNPAMDELKAQVLAYANDDEIKAEVFRYQILFNLIPHIDVADEAGYTKEEWKMINETKKIFGDDNIQITATTVRVPVMRSHSESINIETQEKLTVEQCKEILAKAPGIKVLDDLANYEYPMPLYTSGDDYVWVGRIREDLTVENGLNIWVVADQIRKGAALNAVQIGEYLLPHLR